MKAKKIAVLVESINNHSGSRAPLEIAKSLKKLSLNVTIIGFTSSLDKLLKNELTKLGIKVLVFPKFKGFTRSRLLPDLRIAKALKNNNFDIVLAAAFLPSIAAAKLARIKIVKIYMGSQFNAYMENKNPGQPISIFSKIANTAGNALTYITELIALWLSDKIVAISHYTAKEVHRLYRRNVDQVIYLGGNHLHIIKYHNNKEGSLRLLSISRITPYKGFHHLIDVVGQFQVQNVHLTIAGSPTQKAYYQYLMRIAPSNIEIVLDPTDRQLTRLYQQSHVYVTADRYFFFGMPTVEAAFFFKPTIAFDFAAAKEIIKNNQTGFIVTSREQLARTLRFFLKNPTLAREMGQKAHQRAQNLFAWEKGAKSYIQLFTKSLP